MKIESPKQIDNINILGDFESIEAGMDNSSLPFILEMLSKNFYSNPIGSICREITSNCFDSHIEAKVDDAVIIKIDEDEEGEYISFKDVGMGLSVDRIKSVYMKYFTSTKKNTDDLIGGFGLGSKTPLAYQDYFYITTIFNNIKYSYLFSKGTTLPTLDLLSEEETQEHNGSEIKMYIKNSQDKLIFIRELKSQLCYFDNVYFINCKIDNEYKIYENDLFKYRNKDQYSEEMHICFGKCAYPIDWNQIEEEYIGIPIGIKFQINELVVTPNREMLRYTDEVKTLVKKRVQETKEKLKEMYIAQSMVYEDFFEYCKGKSTKKYLQFGENDFLELKNLGKLNSKHTLKIFKDLELNLDLGDDILKDFYILKNQIQDNKIKKYSTYGNYTESIINYTDNYIFCKDSNYSGIKTWLNHGRILQPKKTKLIVKEILKKYRFKKGVDRTKKLINNGNNDYYNPDYFDLGLSIKLYKFVKYIKQQIESKLKNYHCEINEQQIKDYKEFQDKNNINKKRKLEGKVFIKNLSNNIDVEWLIKDIEEYTGIVVYGSIKDKKELQKAITYLNLKVNLRYNYVSYNNRLQESGYTKKLACKVIQISQTNFKYFKDKKNMVHVTQLYGNNRLFRKIASSYRIQIVFEDYLKNYSGMNNSKFLKQMKIINKSVGDNLEELYNYYKSFVPNENIKYTNYTRIDLRKEILDIAIKHNLFDISIESKLKEVEKFFDGVELLKYVDMNDETLPLILKYLREKKKKINLEYYCKIVTPELQLEFDFEQKGEQIITKFKQITELKVA